MSRPVLPDHRIICSKDVLLEFTEEQVSRIQTKFGFDKNYPLEEKLHKLAIRYEKPSYYRNPPPKSEQKKLLKAIQKSASDLEESLQRVGEPELKLIGKIDADWVHEGKLREVSNIKHVVDNILFDFEVSKKEEVRGKKEGTQPPKGKKRTRKDRPPTVKKKELIARLSDIYQKGTGKTDKYTQEPGTNNYDSNRVKFIEEIVNILNAPVNNRFSPQGLLTSIEAIDRRNTGEKSFNRGFVI
jgi:hypothetical protein